MPEPYGHLDADPGGVEQRGTGGTRGLGHGEGGRDDAGGGVEHRGKVRVVEVERVGERAVDERGSSSRNLEPGPDRSGVGRAAPAAHDRGHRGGGGLAPGGERVPHEVEHASRDVGTQPGRQAVATGGRGEVGELLDDRA